MPARKPTALKAIQGTLRPGRIKNEPKPKPVAAFDPPDYFDEVALDHWNFLRPRLEAVGCLTEVDRAQFISLCSAYSKAIRADRQLMNEDLAVRSNGRTIKNPLCQISKEAWQLYSDLSRRFGLDPQSRGNIDLPEPVDELDEMEILLRQRGG